LKAFAPDGGRVKPRAGASFTTSHSRSFFGTKSARRHGITLGQTIYFFDPSGNRNEVFAGGFIYYPENPKRVWPVDKIAEAIFYYQRELNERFLSVVT
jgi:hypothetical protein